MKRRSSVGAIALAAVLTFAVSACGRSSSDSGSPKTSEGSKSSAPTKVPGFDGSTITLGVLTPLTGQANVIGKPLTEGNKAYFAMLNAQGGIDGKYKVKLDIQDNKYTAQDTITAYNQIKSNVVAFLQILGTPPLKALQPTLDKDDMFAGPATLDAPWYKDEHLMPILAPYQIQAINSVSYYVNNMNGKGKKICALTSTTPYGQAGLEGAKAAVDALGEKLTSSQTFSEGQTDFTAQINALQKANCDMVWFTGLPTASIPMFKRASQVNFAPQWMAQSPAWLSLLPSLTDADYLEKHLIVASEGVAWGDTSVKGMADMLDAIKKYAPDQKPDIYFAFGWMQAKAMTQILQTAIKNGNLSHAGIIQAGKDTKTLTFDGIVNDETFGGPENRDPSRATTLYNVTPKTIDTNGALTLVAKDAQNFSSPAAKAFKFTD